MFIWITAILTTLIGAALLIWHHATDEWEEWKFFAGTISFICGLFILIIILVIQTNVKPEINSFIQQKAYIESHVSDNAIEDAALTTKKVELNDWLYNAQYWLEYRNGWSLYPDSVLNLEPIE